MTSPERPPERPRDSGDEHTTDATPPEEEGVRDIREAYLQSRKPGLDPAAVVAGILAAIVVIILVFLAASAGDGSDEEARTAVGAMVHHELTR